MWLFVKLVTSLKNKALQKAFCFISFLLISYKVSPYCHFCEIFFHPSAFSSAIFLFVLCSSSSSIARLVDRSISRLSVDVLQFDCLTAFPALSIELQSIRVKTYNNWWFALGTLCEIFSVRVLFTGLHSFTAFTDVRVWC